MSLNCSDQYKKYAAGILPFGAVAVVLAGVLLFHLAAWGQTPPQPAPVAETPPETEVKLPANLLGPAYVDLRSGFSMRPPVDFVIGSIPCDTEPAQHAGLPDQMTWDQLKLPSSKALICFDRPGRREQLLVYLLVTRKAMTTEEMHTARQNYWQTFAGKATLGETGTETVSNFPAAVTQVTWQPALEAAAVALRETVIQREKNRYFLVMHVRDTSEGDELDADVDELISSNFVCMAESETKQRRQAARQAAQGVLEPLTSAALKDKLVDQSFYRIRYQGQEVGFQWSRQQVRVMEDQKQHTFEILCSDYVDNAAAAQAYGELLGWRLAEAGAEKTRFIGPVWFTNRCELDSDLKTETFEVQAADRQQPPNLFCEKGAWNENQVTVELCQAVEVEGNGGMEPLQITGKIEKIFLPLTLTKILGSLIEPVLGKEYVFARYFYQTLGFYSLRVAARQEITPQPLVLETKPENAPATGADDQVETEPDPPIKTLYMVGQLNTQGPIVEMWLDEQGQVVVERGGGLELILSSREEIAQRWPKEWAQLEPPVQPPGN